MLYKLTKHFILTLFYFPLFYSNSETRWIESIGGNHSHYSLAHLGIYGKLIMVIMACIVGKFGHHIYNKDNYMLLFTIMIG